MLATPQTTHLVTQVRNRIKEGKSNTRNSVDVTSWQKAVESKFIKIKIQTLGEIGKTHSGIAAK